MRSVVALVLVLAIAFGIYYFSLKRAQPGGTGGSLPAQAISLTGVRNDLLAIAQAEQVYFAEHGSYASLNELTSSGALTMERSGRDGYTYAVETTAGSFTVTARHSGRPGDAEARYPTLTVDQTMQVQQTD